MAVGLELVLSFSHTKNRLVNSCNFSRTEGNEISESLRGVMILMLGCVEIVYLYVSSRDHSRNVEEMSASYVLSCTFVLTAR